MTNSHQINIRMNDKKDIEGKIIGRVKVNINPTFKKPSGHWGETEGGGE